MAPGKKDVPYDIRERTFLFSVRIIKWVRTLPRDMGTQIAARQLVEAATSVGANVEEATGADTPKDRGPSGPSPEKKRVRPATGFA